MATFNLEFSGKWSELKTSYGKKSVDMFTTKSEKWRKFYLEEGTKGIAVQLDFAKTLKPKNPTVYLYEIVQEDGSITRLLRGEEIVLPEADFTA